jgi:hypothetical protein
MKTPLEIRGAKLSKAIRNIEKPLAQLEKAITEIVKAWAGLRIITDKPGADRRKRKTFKI